MFAELQKKARRAAMDAKEAHRKQFTQTVFSGEELFVVVCHDALSV